MRGFDEGFPFKRSQMYLHTHTADGHVRGTAGCVGMMNQQGGDMFNMLRAIGQKLKKKGYKNPSIRVIIGH